MRALVWTRRDFRESSRLVTLLTRDEGKITTLAKGAHRPASPFLGRLDFLNLVRARLGGRPGTLRLLTGVELLHEPRGLRQPRRFLAASYLAEIFDVALPEGRADSELFDLMSGAVVVLERTEPNDVPLVLAGIEMRFLDSLGLLPSLEECSACGARSSRLVLAPAGRGLLCERHANAAQPPLPGRVRAWLRHLAATRSERWSEAADPGVVRAGLQVLERWVGAAIERRPRLRGLALRG